MQTPNALVWSLFGALVVVFLAVLSLLTPEVPLPQ